MSFVRRYLLMTGLTCFISYAAFSEAPVVDDSENFTLLDEQQAAHAQPASRYANRQNNQEEVALAHDDQPATGSMHDDLSLANKLQGLQQELQELRGQLELQTHELAQLKQQQLDFYKDLDARIRQEPVKKATQDTPPLTLNDEQPLTPAPAPASASASALTSPVSTPTNTTRENPADEQISYLAAYELIKNKQYDDAVLAMQTFTTTYPQGGYTANAHYWLGELYMVKKNYPQAIDHFELVLNKFPTSTKSSASLLKIGYALAASGQTEAAKKRLQSVIKNYPDTHAAALALTKLDALNS
ncbi:MAG: tol-pal system protein YbgF [Legionellaceae bacterium]